MDSCDFISSFLNLSSNRFGYEVVAAFLLSSAINSHRTLILPYSVLVFTYAEAADTSIRASTKTNIAKISSETGACRSTTESITGETYRLIRFSATAKTAESRLSTMTFFSPEVHASFIINHEFCHMEYLGLGAFSFFVFSLVTKKHRPFCAYHSIKNRPLFISGTNRCFRVMNCTRCRNSLHLRKQNLRCKRSVLAVAADIAVETFDDCVNADEPEAVTLALGAAEEPAFLCKLLFCG